MGWNVLWLPLHSIYIMVDFKSRGDHFWFGSVFIKKKVTKLKFFLKQTETSSNWPVLVRFGFFRTKTGSNRLGSVFSVWLGFQFWLGFFSLARFFHFGSVCFLVFLIFFSLGSVRFVFFYFRLIKPKSNWIGWFFQNSNRFFFTVRFFLLFFSSFLGLINFLIFLLTPIQEVGEAECFEVVLVKEKIV